MVLYTVVPIEDVLLQGVEPPPQAEVEWEGRRLVVEPLEGGVARVSRLISTDPMDYLNPRWQPGSFIPWPAGRGAAAFMGRGALGPVPRVRHG